jgi:hypothetical protein
MVVEAGADKGSAEYYIATMMFRSSYNRLIFKGLDTNEQKMVWLQRAKEGMAAQQG